jgi:hypothetical protein
VYALLTVEEEQQHAHLAAIRKKLLAQKDAFHTMTKRNQLLAALICHTPSLFRLLFRIYVMCVLKGKYE